MGNPHKSLFRKDLGRINASATVKSTKNKQIETAIINKLKNLRVLLAEQDSKCWEIGDLCIELLDEHNLSLRQISEFTDYSRTRISHFHLTSRTFQGNTRTGYTFQDSLTARQIHIKLPRLEMSPAEIRDVIVKQRNKTPEQIRAFFINHLVEKEQNQHLADSALSYIYKDRLINNCHHADWRYIVPKLSDNSVQLFICDPPFVTGEGYMSKKHSTNGMRVDSDNNEQVDQALNVTLPLFELCLPKLAPDGILILFQGGGRSDRIEVLQAAHDHGMDCLYGLSWDKGNITTGNFLNPYSITTERILIFSRKGTTPQKYQNGLPHSDILHFPTETSSITHKMHQGKVSYGDYHMFQKPPELLEFIVQHHSFPGDLVVEPFGCSGSGSIAAAKLNRQWVYIESNKNNYSWGSQRVFNTVSDMSIQAG